MIGKLGAIVLDAADITGLAAFYAEAVGLAHVRRDDDWITMTTPEGWHIAFQQAPDHTVPRWPDPAHPQQAHLDFLTADMAGAVERAERLGATRLPGGGETYTVLADPAGHPFCLCHRDGVDDVHLSDVCLDCPDGAALAAFYAPLLGMKVTYEGAEGAMISADEQPGVMFQNVAAYQAPRWPDPAYPQQFHLDVDVADIAEAEARVLALGATRLPDIARGTFRVYADPVGHPFCLVW
jgi:catechol-2,3-dioxygenase